MADKSGRGPAVLIVDDHPLFRDALGMALTGAYPETGRALVAGTLAGALDVLARERCDLVLLDLQLSDASEFEGLTRLKSEWPSIPVVIVSATESSRVFAMAKALGASGYLPKSLPLEDLSAALATVLDGGQWFPEAGPPPGDAAAAAARIASLTPAQRRVLGGLAEGLLNKQIAYEMNISVATVKAHMTAIFRKLGANNRTQALLIYQDGLSASDHSAA